MNISKVTFDNVDGYVVLSEHVRRYFTGFHSSYGILIMTAKGNYYITDNRYAEVCKNYFEGTEVQPVIVSRAVEGIDIAVDFLKQDGVKTLGYDDAFTTARELFEMQKQFEGMELVPKGTYFEVLRTIKSDEEVEKIAKVMELSSRAFMKMTQNVKVGMTEKELGAELNFQLFNLGADVLSFDTIVASGPNGSKCHAVPSDRKVEKGDLVTFDFGGKLDGYHADITRTIAFGKISKEQEDLYNLVLEAQLLGLQNIKEGVMANEVDIIVREFFKSKNVEEYFVHGLGHGVGVEIHERPTLSAKAPEKVELKENMIVTCEPGLYIPGKMGIRIEDTVCVTKTGCRNLATCTKELIYV